MTDVMKVQGNIMHTKVITSRVYLNKFKISLENFILHHYNIKKIISNSARSSVSDCDCISIEFIMLRVKLNKFQKFAKFSRDM